MQKIVIRDQILLRDLTCFTKICTLLSLFESIDKDFEAIYTAPDSRGIIRGQCLVYSLPSLYVVLCCARVEAVYILAGARRHHSGNVFSSRKTCVHIDNCALRYVNEE